MHLLNTETLALREFLDDREVKGKYAILSHTWHEDEVTFDDIGKPAATKKKGYAKIKFACDQARKDGLPYAWVDTCCIDKKSSSELSEAINSMYRWYYHARFCYVYFSDKAFEQWDHRSESALSKTNDCRWYRRGWTLQELIAPSEIYFYDKDWRFLGKKTEHARALSELTKIDAAVLENRDALHRMSVGKRMSWAAHRQTTRLEDAAYCLLGIFGVNMPLLYGEGSKAFERLQEEIIGSHIGADHSILAWRSHEGGLLAPSPVSFGIATQMVAWTLPQAPTFSLSNKGLLMNAYAKQRTVSEGAEHEDEIVVALDCSLSERRMANGPVALRFRRRPIVVELREVVHHAEQSQEVLYDRLPGLPALHWSKMEHFIRQDLLIARTAFPWPRTTKVSITLPQHRLELRQRHTSINERRTTIPRGDWKKEESMIYLAKSDLFSKQNSSGNEYGCVELQCPGDGFVNLAVILAYSSSVGDHSAPAHLFVEQMNPGQDLQDLHKKMYDKPNSSPGRWKNGELRVITMSSGITLTACARLVIVTGEVLWNLRFGVSGESEKGGDTEALTAEAPSEL